MFATVVGQTPDRPAAPLAFGPVQGVLMLANGQALHGTVTRAGDHYFVVVPNGEIRLRAAEVELFCNTLDEGYARKLSLLMPGDVAGHLDLADWCVRHELFGYAAKQLADATAIDPRHPRIELVDRRLQLARQRRTEETPVAEATAHGPSNDDLDRLVRALPPGVVEQYSSSIQPLLLNHCTASGCHGPTSATSYSLMRIPLGRTPSRRLTQRNLFATIQHIDRARPAESKLVRACVEPHGTAKTSILTGRDVYQYQQLVVWVQRLAESNRTQPTAQLPADKTNESRTNVLLQTMPPSTAPSEVAKPASDPAAQTAIKRLLSEDRDVAAAKSDTYTPRDPFDAEVFNRKHFKEPKE